MIRRICWFSVAGCAALLVALWLTPAGIAAGADLLLLHGHIYTGNPKAPWAQAIAISGSRIEAIGTDEEIARLRQAKTELVDLHGRTVIPGISDSHTHMWFGSLALRGINLSTPEYSITPDAPDSLVEKIKAFAVAHPAEKILFGRADFSSTPPATPSHELLDRAVSDRPLIIHNTSEHALWLNAKALALAGITDKPVADPSEERYILRDASGHPSGVLLESAMAVVERALQKQFTTDEKLAILAEGARYLNRYGITSVNNATGDLAEIELYGKLRDQGRLTVRTRTSFGAVAVNHQLTPQLLDDLEKARSQYHDGFVSANLVKFFADGGTGLIPPLTYEPSGFKALVRELDKRGFQIMTHVLRADSAHMVLDAYEALEKENGPRDRRLRLEHGDSIAQEDLPRLAALHVVASMQPSFCCSETGGNTDPYDKTISDRWQSLLQSGAALAFGSDWPCTSPPDPMVSIQQAVTRQVWRDPVTSAFLGGYVDGAGQGGATATPQVYVPLERLTVAQAVDAFTRGSAYAQFSDDRFGTLEAGKEADLAVLSQDIFSVRAGQIARTKVVATMVAGKLVFGEWK
jgi:predicted amidohydrolase YtcJ